MRYLFLLALLALPSLAFAATTAERLDALEAWVCPGESPCAPPNIAPVAGFSYSCADLVCSYTGTATDVDGMITTWSWDFGDGTISTAQSPSHSYGAAGTYGVSLAVIDDAGASDSVSHDVAVSDAPPAAGIPPAIAGLAPGAWLHHGTPWKDAFVDGGAWASQPCGKRASAVLTAWNGGAWDGRYLWVAASGGHDDGCDNGVYRYDVYTGQAEMVIPHAELNAGLDTDLPFVADADGVQILPRSSHTYEGVVVRDGRLFLMVGSPHRRGSASQQVWSLDLATLAWSRLPDRPGWSPLARIMQRGDGSRIWLSNWRLCEADLEAGDYSDCQNDLVYSSIYATMAWDEARGGLWHLDSRNGRLRFLHKVDGTWQIDAALGSAALPAGIINHAGICVVPGANGGEPLIWSSAAELFRWDGAQWHTIAAPGGPGEATQRWPLSKWTWDAAMGVCLGAHRVDQGMWIYRP